MADASEWQSLLVNCGVKNVDAQRWAPAFSEVVKPENFSLGTEELDDFVAQVLHESSFLKRMEEDLYYSRPERLMQVWPKRFLDIGTAEAFTKNPQLLAEKVYGGRMGNTEYGDGWKYRGSGPIMVTGKGNFQVLEGLTGYPLVEQPDLLRIPGETPLNICRLWWEGNVPDSVMGDVRKITKKVNGGDVGLHERLALTTKVRTLMGL